MNHIIDLLMTVVSWWHDVLFTSLLLCLSFCGFQTTLLLQLIQKSKIWGKKSTTYMNSSITDHEIREVTSSWWLKNHTAWLRNGTLGWVLLSSVSCCAPGCANNAACDEPQTRALQEYVHEPQTGMFLVHSTYSKCIRAQNLKPCVHTHASL